MRPGDYQITSEDGIRWWLWIGGKRMPGWWSQRADVETTLVRLLGIHGPDVNKIAAALADRAQQQGGNT